MTTISLCGAPRYALFMSKYGDWVRSIREGAGLTQQQFASRISIGRQEEVARETISNWERGRQPPERENIEAIMEAFPGSQPPPGFAPATDGASILVPETPEAREIAFMVDKLPKSQREYAREMMVRTFGRPGPHAHPPKRPGSKPRGARK